MQKKDVFMRFFSVFMAASALLGSAVANRAYGGFSYWKLRCDASNVTICSLSGPTEIIGIGTLRYAST